jgi:endonuclease/exonuclease/phosphatase family protein
MKEIDADVYAICEIEEGDYSVNELVQALNEEYGVTGKYKGIDSGDKKITSYTKNAFIYDTERVSPYMDFKTYEGTYLVLRHVAQCFELKENGQQSNFDYEPF